jgi:hypothetical protein
VTKRFESEVITKNDVADFDRFWNSYDTKKLIEISYLASDSSSDNEVVANSITNIFGLKNGGIYRVQSKVNPLKRQEVDDKVLEVETTLCLLDKLRETYPDIHSHNNLKLWKGKVTHREYDSFLHGAVSGPTVGFLLESKYSLHPSDIGKILERAAELESFFNSKSVFDKCTVGGYTKDAFQDLPVTDGVAHFYGVKKVVPVIASANFEAGLLNQCKERGIITVSQSGFRYVMRNLKKVAKHLVL